MAVSNPSGGETHNNLSNPALIEGLLDILEALKDPKFQRNRFLIKRCIEDLGFACDATILNATIPEICAAIRVRIEEMQRFPKLGGVDKFTFTQRAAVVEDPQLRNYFKSKVTGLEDHQSL